MSRPGIDTISALLPAAKNIIPIEDHKCQSKAIFQFFSPLKNHGRRARDDNAPHLLPHQKFAEDRTCFNCFTRANVVCDEEIHPRKLKSLAKWFELIVRT